MDLGAFLVSMSCFFSAGFFLAKYLEERKRIKKEGLK